MLDPAMEQGLNDHINAEAYSAYLYYSMAAYFDHGSFPGFANWMKVQAQEEMSHAIKSYEFLIERGGVVRLAAIEAPPVEWTSPLDCFRDALEHEKLVSARIDELVALAEKKKDRATRIFLEWFVTEQVEEEATIDSLIQQLQMIEGAPHALFMMDRELGQRTFQPPV